MNDPILFNLYSAKDLFTIMHVLAVAVGAGAAFFSDFLFAHILKERRINESQMAIITLASTIVWVGLAVLALSGLGLFFSDVERYSESTKFLVKLTLVMILLINGVVFHIKHLPVLQRTVGTYFNQSLEFIAASRSFFISGAVSATSWGGAIVLGSVRSVPFSYVVCMLIYGCIIAGAIFVSQLLRQRTVKGS